MSIFAIYVFDVNDGEVKDLVVFASLRLNITILDIAEEIKKDEQKRGKDRKGGYMRNKGIIFQTIGGC